MRGMGGTRRSMCDITAAVDISRSADASQTGVCFRHHRVYLSSGGRRRFSGLVSKGEWIHDNFDAASCCVFPHMRQKVLSSALPSKKPAVLLSSHAEWLFLPLVCACTHPKQQIASPTMFSPGEVDIGIPQCIQRVYHVDCTRTSLPCSGMDTKGVS